MTGIGYFPAGFHQHPFTCEACGLPGIGKKGQRVHPTQACRMELRRSNKERKKATPTNA
jgi:hypothetical protein